MKNNYNFVNIKAKAKSYYQANKDKIEKKLSEYYSNIIHHNNILLCFINSILLLFG